MEDNTIINFDKFLDNHSFSDEQLEKEKRIIKNLMMKVSQIKN